MAWLIPDVMVKGFNNVDAEFLRGLGVRGIIVDIDNTLVPPDVPVPSAEAAAWLRTIRSEGFRICLLSNNSRERVEIFNRELGLSAVWKARKPLTPAFKKAAQIMKLKPEEIAVVGDQVFTDVAGAHAAGMKMVLTEPLELKETLFFRFKRSLEKPFIRSYRRRNGGGRD